MQPLTINMCFKLCSDGDGIDSIAKCLKNLGETGLRPPPGGAQAAAKVTS